MAPYPKSLVVCTTNVIDSQEEGKRKIYNFSRLPSRVLRHKLQVILSAPNNACVAGEPLGGCKYLGRTFEPRGFLKHGHIGAATRVYLGRLERIQVYTRVMMLNIHYNIGYMKLLT